MAGVNGPGYPGAASTAGSSTSSGCASSAGAWPSGTPLPNEDELAAELGVSRTVVREAIKALQAKGLVEVTPEDGYPCPAAACVAPPRRRRRRVAVRRHGAGEDLRELYEIRASIAVRRRTARRRRDGPRSSSPRSRPTSGGSKPRPPSRSPARAPSSTSTTRWSMRPTTRCSSHVGAMVRVALEAAGEPPAPATTEEEELLRAAVVKAVRAGDADASEAAMRSLVESAWARVVAQDK